MVMMRVAALSTYCLAPPSGTPPLLPIPLPTSSPPLLLPSTNYRADVLEVTLPPRKRLCIAPGLKYEIGESSSAHTARSTRGFKADYGFVVTLDAKIRRDPDREIVHGLAFEKDSVSALTSRAHRSTLLLNVRLRTKGSKMIINNNKIRGSTLEGPTLLGMGRRSHIRDLKHYALNATITMMVHVHPNATSATELTIWPVTVGVLQMPILLTTKGALGQGDCDNVTTDDNEDAYLSSNSLLDVNHGDPLCSRLLHQGKCHVMLVIAPKKDSIIAPPSTPPSNDLNIAVESSSSWLDYVGPLTSDELDSVKR
nr:hypothetical protein [Tanacetum cinerariifolium]